MSYRNLKYIYGPVSSWRLGSSLGIDPISGKKKVCTFDCIYCQLGKTKTFSRRRKIYIPSDKLIKEIKSLASLKIDYITFSGRGEPTLAKNLGNMIRAIRRIIKEKIAVITNASLIDRPCVQEDLKLADLVMVKIDAPSGELFLRVNRPIKGIIFDKILRGIKEFRSKYKGRLALQMMFVEENKDLAGEMADLAKEINLGEIYLSTPLRPCSVRPLSKKEMDIIKAHFKDMKAISIYDLKKKRVSSINKEATLKRRGSHD